MHIQLFHATKFSITTLAPSNRPEGIKTLRNGEREKSFNNALVAFTCIEKNDDKSSVKRAVKEIIKVYNDLNNSGKKGCKKIVLIPYSHQRNMEKNSAKAIDLLVQLRKTLNKEIEYGEIHLGDFGFCNSWSIEVKSHRLSSLYRQA